MVIAALAGPEGAHDLGLKPDAILLFTGAQHLDQRWNGVARQAEDGGQGARPGHFPRRRVDPPVAQAGELRGHVGAPLGFRRRRPGFDGVLPGPGQRRRQPAPSTRGGACLEDDNRGDGEQHPQRQRPFGRRPLIEQTDPDAAKGEGAGRRRGGQHRNGGAVQVRPQAEQSHQRQGEWRQGIGALAEQQHEADQQAGEFQGAPRRPHGRAKPSPAARKEDHQRRTQGDQRELIEDRVPEHVAAKRLGPGAHPDEPPGGGGHPGRNAGAAGKDQKPPRFVEIGPPPDQPLGCAHTDQDLEQAADRSAGEPRPALAPADDQQCENGRGEWRSPVSRTRQQQDGGRGRSSYRR